MGIYLKSVLEEDKRLSGIYVKGEIADLRDHYSSGHIYFTLKEGGSSIKAVMFQTHAARLRFGLADGMAVIVRGDISFYPKDGSCQLYAYDIQPDGVGAKYIALEQLKQKLLAEGLFAPEHKRALPKFPASIGVVTSSSGAALQDILRVLKRRWPAAEVIVSPALVQGSGAAKEIARAIRLQNEHGRAEVLIVGRGGGSADDLFVFNDEAVVRAVYESRIPIVSAVGHETDYTLCDLAADLRAPTPSAAAELVSPDMDRLRSFTAGAGELLASGLHRLLGEKRETLMSRQNGLRRAEALFMRDEHDRLARRMEQLESRSPVRLLMRGYVSATADGRAVSSVKKLKPGETLELRFSDGVATAEVKKIEEAAL